MAKRHRPPVSRAQSSRGIAPIILAAGASSRLGQCKALVDLDGSTPLERLASGAREMSACAPLVVAGVHHEQIAAQLPAGCELLHNPDSQSGRTGGLALAAERRSGYDLAVIPVDVPRVPPTVFLELAAAWQAQESPASGWLAPRIGKNFGHPILIGRELAAQLRRFPPDRPLSELRSKASPLFSFMTDSEEVFEDLDTPNDLANLRHLLNLKRKGHI